MPFAIMNQRIVRLKGQGRVDRLLGARIVACAGRRSSDRHAKDQSIRQGRRARAHSAGREQARARTASIASFKLALVPGRSNLASACIARSTASGLLRRSRVERRASAMTSSSSSELARRDTASTCSSPSLLRSLEAVGPDMRAGLGRDELRVDRDRLADAPHAALLRHSARRGRLPICLASTDLPL